MTASASEITNAPVEVTMAGRRLKVRRLSVLKILELAESYVLNNRIEVITKVAGRLNGEQLAFVNAQTEKLPQGSDLESLAQKELSSQSFSTRLACDILHAAMQDDQPEMTVHEVAELFDTATNAEVRPVIDIVRGGKKKSPRRKPSPKSRC